MTDNTTLSRIFSSDGFIAPDIVSNINEGIRTATADMLKRGKVTEGLDEIVIEQDYRSPLLDVFTHGDVPSLEPEEFVSYKPPDIPTISDFDTSEYAVFTDIGSDLDSDIKPEVSIDSEEEEAVTVGLESEFEDVPDIRAEADIDIVIPEALYTLEEETPEPEDMVVEMPEIPSLDEGLKKVKHDTIIFDEGFREKFRTIAIIAMVAAAIFLLVYYLLQQ